jgi:competence protein ComEA
MKCSARSETFAEQGETVHAARSETFAEQGETVHAARSETFVEQGEAVRAARSETFAEQEQSLGRRPLSNKNRGKMLSTMDRKNTDDSVSKREIQRQVWQAYRWNLIVVSAVSVIVGMLIGVFGIAAESGISADPLTPPPDWDVGRLPMDSDPASSRTESLSVYVSGAVHTPQVITLTTGSLVVDALDAVGGPAPDADLDAVNLAAPLANHQQIIIPRRVTETQRVQRVNPPPAEGVQHMEEEDEVIDAMGGETININTATAAMLEQLPRIGPTLAERIIAYREENGGFATVEEIQNVSGIGEGTFAQLAPYIMIGP